MNTKTPLIHRLGLFVLALPFVALVPGASAQTASVTINANSVVRDVPVGLMGVNVNTGPSKFWQSVSPAYREDLVAARMGTVRISTYPEDLSNPSSAITIPQLDTRVAQILNAGSVPVFFQAINDIGKTYSDTRDAAVHAKYVDLNGNLYPSGSTVPTAQRIATNMAYLVNRYKAPPFNMTHQIWEVGNEPDINVNYQVENSAEYIATFQAVHNQLVASGLRGNVTLCGPVVSWDYGFGGFRDTLMRDFLDACKDQVDIVTRHIYGKIYSWESTTYTPYNLLNATFETAHFNAAQSGSRGEGKLLAEMNTCGVPSTVGTGVTEMNLFANDGGTNTRHTITQGLWFLLSNHYSLHNPRSRLTTGFKFDKYNDQLAYYKPDQSRSFPYWATYIHGHLTGDQIVSHTSNNSHVVVTASKDDSYLYVQVLNRHDTNTYSTTVTINNAPPVTAPTLYTLSATATPDVGVSTTHGTTFTRSFAPMTASVLRFPRTDAPTPPAPPAAPTTSHINTTFASAPSGMATYQVGFTPVVASGRLQLTSATTNTRSAVVFNGQPLPAAASRAQIKFGFRVDDTASTTRGEGFVFGVYSANPGAVGNGGQALGYTGQNNRLFGVKIDNNPDQVAVLAGASDASVEGWSTTPLADYANANRYVVIDYEGAAGTVRARVYAGTAATGTPIADVTNRFGNPSSLPAGTVFGFTAATSANTQLTYIEDLIVTTAAALTPGTPFNLQSWMSAPWSATTGVTSFSGGFTSGGSPVTFTFGAPKTGVNVNNPASPDFSGAANSYFGFESSGFGVGDATTGRFNIGESFTLQATRGFVLNEIRWSEWNGDELVHIQWTSNGVVQQQVFTTPAAITTYGFTADANTPVVFTNVSPTSSSLVGRLRVTHIGVSVLQ